MDLKTKEAKIPRMKSDPRLFFTRARTLCALKHLALGGAACLVTTAELLFGVRPFGVALAAAMPLTYLPAALLGALCGSLIIRDYLTLAALGILLVVRAFFSLVMEPGGREHPFCERAGLRIAAAATATAAAGVFTAVP